MGNQRDRPNLADRVKLTASKEGEELISLFGTGRQVFQRVLQVLAGQQDVSGIAVGIDKVVRLGGTLIDATQAPLRVNGRKWSCAYNLAAPGATNNQVRVQNRTSSQPKDGLVLATIEEVRYQGPSVCGAKILYPASIIAEIPTGDVRDMELPIAPNDGAIREKSVVPYLGSLESTGSTSPDWQAFLGNVAAGNTPDVWNPDGWVLWPGEMFDLFQITQNVVMTVTISGKLWVFSGKAAA